MRRFLLYIACAIGALAIGGCSTFDEGVIDGRDGELTLRLSLGDITRYSTPDNGVGQGTNDDDTAFVSLNENKITSIEVFLYPNGGEESNALYASRIEGLNSRDMVQDLSFSIPADVLGSLFAGNKTTCGIYVVANCATGRTTATNGVYENTSISELKSIEIEADFGALQSLDLTSFGADYGSIANIKPQDSFVMDSDLGTVTKSGNDLSGTVYLTRAASKITFRATIAESLKIDDTTWVPLLDKLTFTYNNVVNKSLIDNGSDTDTNNSFAMPSDETFYADVEGIQMSSLLSDKGAQAPTYDGDVVGVSNWITVDHIVPLYSYSSRWADGANNEAYIMLTVPWKAVDDTSDTLTYYNYFVPLNMNDLKLVRNKHYRINLRVGVLGDLEELTESEFSYEVLDWVGESVDVTLQKPTYLVVDSNYVEMKNIEEFSVGYQSSDEVAYEVRSTTISALKKQDGVYVSGCVHEDYTVTAANGNVTFHHLLDNTRSDTDTDYDFLVQTTVVRIYHKSNPSIYEDITFVQYPAMYVTTEVGNTTTKNYINVNGHNYSSWNDNNGAAGSGCPSYNGKKVFWVGIGGKKASGLNPNIYQITVTAFDETTANYIIADPRDVAKDITMFPQYNHGSSSQAPDYPVQPDQRNVTTIKGYRGTRSEGSDNLVAPAFIVASFLSTCMNADQYLYPEDSAYYRCASYQEAGYPAGRWRIPTTAELEVIGKLCAQDKLPSIFTNDQNYPSASGIFKYTESKNNTGSFKPTTSKATSLRCVYDTWYWRDKCNSTSEQKLLWAADGNVDDMIEQGVYSTYLETIW